MRGGLLTLDPSTQLAATVLAGRLARGELDELAAEEGALALLDALSRGRHGDEGGAPVADRVRVLLAADPGRRWKLEAVATEARCSPFHLARRFRAATGHTVSAHLLWLRLARALEHIAAGEDDLARLAADLGFTHHSHFSARFRAVLSLTPSQARARLRAGS